MLYPAEVAAEIMRDLRALQAAEASYQLRKRRNERQVGDPRRGAIARWAKAVKVARACIMCGATFDAYQPMAMFCSRRCNKAWQRRRAA